MKIHDTQSLEKAIAELETKKLLIEQKLDANGEHLHKNFVSMTFKSVMPANAFETGPIAAAGQFLKSDKLKDGFARLMNSVTEMASEGMETIVSKFKGKKDNSGL